MCEHTEEDHERIVAKLLEMELLSSKAVHTHSHLDYHPATRDRVTAHDKKFDVNPDRWRDKKHHLRTTANRQYDRVKAEFRLAMRDVVFGWQKGKYSAKEFEKLGRAAFDKAYEAAFRLGLKASGVALLDHPRKRKEGPQLARHDERWIKYSLQDERKYWNKFMLDVTSGAIAAKRFTAAERIDMYADTLDHVYDAARVVGHPSHSIIYWVLNKEKETCPLCLFLQQNSPYTRETLPGVPRDGNTCMGLSRCFVEDTQLLGKFDGGSARAFYSGPLVTLDIGGAKPLRVTSNHPVLTPFGWRPAGELCEGDEVISNLGSVETSRLLLGAARMSGAVGVNSPVCVDLDESPMLAKDLFDTLSVAGSHLSRWTGLANPEDFDGDAAFFQGDVHGVLPESSLLDYLDTTISQLLRQLILMPSTAAQVFLPALGHAFDSFTGLLLSTGSIPSGGTLTSNQLWVPGELFPRSVSSSTLISGFDSAPVQQFTNHVSGHGVRVSQAVDAFSHAKLLDHVRHGVQMPFDGMPTARIKLLSARTDHFSGMVYDFSTVHGAMLADNICISNCGCELKIITLDDDTLWQNLRKRSRDRLTRELSRLRKLKRSAAMDSLAFKRKT